MYKRNTITEQMPDHYCADDAQYINQKLSTLQRDERARVCMAYSKAYKLEYDKEPIEYKKVNKARLAANIRLMIYIDKKIKKTLG